MRTAVAFLALLLSSSALAEQPSIIPNPASITSSRGAFVIDARTALVADDAALARDVAALFERTHGIRFASAARHAITLHLDRSLAHEAYRLEVDSKRVTISARDAVGLRYGATTLWQLVPLTKPHRIPALTIEDAPRFPWRGLMLDSARHYQSPAFIRDFIDWMALHKLNVLHWHLTDDQGWRLEIKKYPRLTEVGAWRIPASASRTAKPPLYGGFYTQDEVRRIVAYAAARGITIVPEIELPGHGSAAFVAYPALDATIAPARVPADWGIYPDVYSLDDKTFAFLEDVLDEVIALFPSTYIHIGGDEVQGAYWGRTEAGRARMRELGLTDPKALQHDFTQRIAAFLARRGRRAVGWDEILAPGLPASAVVMSWNGSAGAFRAAARGNDAVLAPWPTLYFDNRQTDAASEPPGRTTVISLRDVYAFEPLPADADAAACAHILGVEAAIWTEHIRTEQRVGWMTFPRAAAVAELGWSRPERREWGDFDRRLPALLARYDKLGIPRAMPPAPGALDPSRRTSRELELCSQAIGLGLEDDAPLDGARAIFDLDLMNPCWIWRNADLGDTASIEAAVGQVPFNFQIGDDVKKIVFAKPTTPEGELEVHLDACDGAVIARLPLEPATHSDTVTVLPQAKLAAHGYHDLCFKFAQPRLDPLYAIDRVRLIYGDSP